MMSESLCQNPIFQHDFRRKKKNYIFVLHDLLAYFGTNYLSCHFTLVILSIQKPFEPLKSRKLKIQVKIRIFRAASVSPWSNDSPSDSITSMQADNQKYPKIKHKIALKKKSQYVNIIKTIRKVVNTFKTEAMGLSLETTQNTTAR